jgi:hypothetical protein
MASQSPLSPKLELPPGLRGRLEAFRKTTWRLKLAEALVAGCFGLLVSYAAVVVLDRFLETPVEARSLIFLAGFAGFGIGLPLTWERWSWRMRGLEAAARLIRRKMPRFGDQLLGTVQLAGNTSGSPALVRAAMQQADRKAAETNLREALPGTRSARWLALLAAGGALVAVLFFVSPEAGFSSLLRWGVPWVRADRYTFARMAEVPGRVIVPYGEPYRLDIGLDEGSRWFPEWGRARVEGRGEAVARAAREAEGTFPFSLPGRKAPGVLEIAVGDDRARTEVVPAERPELSALRAEIRLPQYLRYSRPLRIEARDGTIPAVEGSEVRVELETSRPVASAEIDEGSLAVEGQRLLAGPWTAAGVAERRVMWRDELGLSPREPLRFRIVAREDAPPRILAKSDSAERTVLSTEVVSLDVEASDDFGVREVGLRWEGDKIGSKIVSAGSPELTETRVRATFCAERERVEPQTIRLTAYVADYRPGRPLVHSKPFTLRILSADEHLRWLTDELAAWLRRAEEVQDREKQLHVENRALRSLPAAELDSEANRQRLKEQAEAEDANGRRLEQLAAAGRRLAEEATRNEGFDAERLDAFARALERLQEIAKDRMPSVAELLREASEAPRSEGGAAPAGDPAAPTEPKDPEDAQVSPTPPSPPSPPSPPDQDLKSLTPEAPSAPKAGGGAPSSPGAPGLPSTNLQGQATAGEEPSAAREPATEAVVEQTGLLAELAAIQEEMRDLLGSLQTSTFVRRLKAASREQLGIASDLGKTLAGEFGLGVSQLSQDALAIAREAARRQIRQSEVLHEIRSDLEAYAQRRPMPPLKKLLEEMRATEVGTRIRRIAADVEANLNGRSVTESEYWADTLDRWAEELVEAGQQGGGQEGSSGDSPGLPPALVLEVMKILRDEIDLRDETRETEAAKPALDGEEFRARAKALEDKQRDLRDRTHSVVKRIEDQPQGGDVFAREIELMSAVARVLGEARNILARPDTGPEAIAAETEAIELLLQARRNPPQGGGSQGGSQAPGAPQEGVGGLGPGAEEEPSAPRGRSVDQSTGKEGREFPEEFRRGLDEYFNRLEKEAP